MRVRYAGGLLAVIPRLLAYLECRRVGVRAGPCGAPRWLRGEGAARRRGRAGEGEPPSGERALGATAVVEVRTG
jgi:hypothetical protein